MRLWPIPRLKHNLGSLFVLYILIFSTFAALLSTGVQLFFEYRRDIDTIEKTAEQIGKSYIATIVQALWAYDIPILERQLQGIRNLPDVSYAGIRKDHKIFIETDPGTVDKNFLSYKYPLLHEARNKQMRLGELEVKMGLSGVYQRLWDRVVVILLTQTMKTFLVSVFIFLLFYFIVGRHLNTMADFARSMNLENLENALRLNRKRKKGREADELGIVESALNSMRENLVYEMANVRLSQEALKKSEERFKSLVTNIPGIVYRRRMAPLWKVDFISDPVEGISGHPPRDFLNGVVGFAQLIHPEDSEGVADAVATHVAKGDPFEIGYRIRHKDGSIRHVMEKGKAIYGETHEPLWIDGVILDVSEKREMQERLSERDVLLHAIIENTSDAVFMKDVEGRYVIANTAALNAIGRPESDVIGKTDFELFPRDSAETIKQTDSRALVSGGSLIEEERLETAYGETYWQANKRPLMDSAGNLIGLVGISRNITRFKNIQRENEELQKKLIQAQKMEAIGNLAGGIAHEFNNVLGIILGNAELAMDDVSDWNPAKESLREIRTASFRAKEVVRQILSFARKTMTALKPLEINTIVKESLKLMRASIPTMIDIQSNIPSESKMILGDPTEIHQIVINLCINAGHAMKETGGVLEVAISEVSLDADNAALYEELTPGNFVKLTVKDSGQGMPSGVLEKAFEPYFTTKEFGEGSGMGLAVVYGLVKKCNGVIDIKSTVGEGTTVEILFPKIDEQPHMESKTEEALPTGAERILLVDDDESIVRMVQQMLERLGYRVEAMTDSVAALERFKSNSDEFDLVITDMSMPKMSGDQLAGELIKARKDIPILLCTGHSDSIDEKKAKEIGIQGFAMKPLDKAKLARAVRAILDKNHDA